MINKNTDILGDLSDKQDDLNIQQLRRNAKISKELISNEDYISWLEKFTIEHPYFDDEYWQYFPEEITDNDLKNVQNLNLFFQAIEHYAQKNYIFPNTDNSEFFYSIKHNKIGYEIGLIPGQGTVFFCQKTKARKSFIDFKNILNKKQKNYSKIKLLKLSK